jgi:hypothetical protein
MQQERTTAVEGDYPAVIYTTDARSVDMNQRRDSGVQIDTR